MRGAIALLLVLGCVPPVATPNEDAGDDDGAGDDDDSTPDGPFEEACAATPTAPAEAWSGPLFDAHVHTSIFPDQDQEDFARWLLEEMNRAGVERAVVVGPHVTHFSEHMDWLRDLEAEWADMVTRCDRLLFQLNAFEPEDATAVDYVAARLDEAPFAGVGAVDLAHPFSSSSPDAAGIPPILDLLEERGLPFQFHGLVDDDDPFFIRMLEIVQARPTLQFVWFGCPDAMLFGPPLDNLSCTALPVSIECDSPCSGPATLALGRSILGMDIGPAGFNPWPEGESPFGYDSFEGGAAEARLRLADLPEDLAASVAHSRFEGAFGTR